MTAIHRTTGHPDSDPVTPTARSPVAAGPGPVREPARPLYVELPFTVRTYDIDFAGHVSNQSYIRWLEDLRFALLETHFPLSASLTGGVLPVLVRTEIDYRRAVKLFEPVIGCMWVADAGSVRVELHARFTVGQTLCAAAQQFGAFASAQTGRLMRVPRELRRLFNEQSGG